MKTVFEHIEHIKGKPHHVRKRIAFGTAAAGAGLVAVVWLAINVTGGAFAIPDNSFADAAGQGSVVATTSERAATNLAGVAAAVENQDAPAHIEIVDTTPASTSQKKAERTIIPF